MDVQWRSRDPTRQPSSDLHRRAAVPSRMGSNCWQHAIGTLCTFLHANKASDAYIVLHTAARNSSVSSAQQLAAKTAYEVTTDHWITG